MVWDPSDQNPADVLTGINSKIEHLLIRLMENKLYMNEKYWVERTASQSPTIIKTVHVALHISYYNRIYIF